MCSCFFFPFFPIIRLGDTDTHTHTKKHTRPWTHYRFFFLTLYLDGLSRLYLVWCYFTLWLLPFTASCFSENAGQSESLHMRKWSLQRTTNICNISTLTLKDYSYVEWAHKSIYPRRHFHALWVARLLGNTGAVGCVVCCLGCICSVKEGHWARTFFNLGGAGWWGKSMSGSRFGFFF